MSEARTLDPLLENYLERSIDVLATAGTIAIERHSISHIGESRARLRTALRFPGGNHLEVRLLVGISEDIPLALSYSFHYMNASNVTIFRYDNSDYHPGLPHAPHHKHVGADERVVGYPQPSLHDIRDEIEAYLKELN